jgi:hypothetical protein
VPWTDGSPLADELIGPDTVVPIAESASGSVFLKGETKVWNREDLVAVGSSVLMRMLELGIQSFCSIPLITRKGKLGTLNLGSATDHAFAPQDICFLKQVAACIYWGHQQTSHLESRIQKMGISRGDCAN